MSFPPEVCRPFVNAAVGLYRQYLSTHASQGDPYQIDPRVLQTGYYVLWTDARNSADMGVRPLWTQEDLDDWPALDLWLRQPLGADVPPSGQGFTGGNAQSGSKSDMAGMVRVLRTFAADFRRREWSSFVLSRLRKTRQGVSASADGSSAPRCTHRRT